LFFFSPESTFNELELADKLNEGKTKMIFAIEDDPFLVLIQ